jgi:hypothetical protein
MKDFKSNKKKLETLIHNFDKQSKSLPKLKRMLKEVERNEKIIKLFPYQSKFPKNIYNHLNQGLQYFSDEVGDINDVDLSCIDTSYSLIVSGSSASYSEISEFNICDQNEADWKYSVIDIFNNENKDKSLEKEIIDFFNEISASKNKIEFENLLKNKEEFQKNQIDHSAFSNKMRNICLHFKGLLKKAADIEKFGISKKTNNNKMSWPKMAKQIVLDQSKLRKDFEEHGKKWTKIHSNLSGKLKDYDIENKDELIKIFDEVVRLLCAFIVIVDKEKVKKAI